MAVIMEKIKNVTVAAYVMLAMSVLSRIIIVLSNRDILSLSDLLVSVIVVLSTLFLLLWYVLLDYSNEKKFIFSKPKGKAFRYDPVKRYRALKTVIKVLLVTQVIQTTVLQIVADDFLASPDSTINLIRAYFMLLVEGVLYFGLLPIIAVWCFIAGRKLKKKRR